MSVRRAQTDNPQRWRWNYIISVMKSTLHTLSDFHCWKPRNLHLSRSGGHSRTSTLEKFETPCNWTFWQTTAIISHWAWTGTSGIPSPTELSWPTATSDTANQRKVIHFIHFLSLPTWNIGPLSGFLRSHRITHTAGLLWTSDQPVAETSTYTGNQRKVTVTTPPIRKQSAKYNQSTQISSSNGGEYEAQNLLRYTACS
jgi:hypothetical protein